MSRPDVKRLRTVTVGGGGITSGLSGNPMQDFADKLATDLQAFEESLGGRLEVKTKLDANGKITLGTVVIVKDNIV